MWEFWFDLLRGWVGVAGLAIIGCVAVAFLVPPLRPYAIALAFGIAGMAKVYASGRRDQAIKERERRDEVAGKLGKEYDEIERRPDSIDHVKGRINDGSF